MSLALPGIEPGTVCSRGTDDSILLDKEGKTYFIYSVLMINVEPDRITDVVSNKHRIVLILKMPGNMGLFLRER